METWPLHLIAVFILVPAFSAFACSVLVAFSLQNFLTNAERKLKRIILLYLFVSGMGWFVTFCYQFAPTVFVWFNVMCLLTYTLPAIFFYRIIRYLTLLDQSENFSRLHYLLPGALAVVLLGWSLSVPFDVQLEIVESKAQVFPVGYESYARFFTTKPLLRVIFGLVYYVLTIWLLIRYYKQTNGKNTLVRKPAKWVLFLVGISLASLFSSLLPTFMPRSQIFYSLWTFMVAASIATQHIMLSYHIIRRNYLLYILPEMPLRKPKELKVKTESMPEIETNAATKTKRRHYTGKVTQTVFEKFMRDNKPYLQAGYKISDLVNDLNVNRTFLSAYINQTYGMNFSRYLNCCRLKELERLSFLPENKEKSISMLVKQVGFRDYRTYARAAAIEREAAAKNKGKGKKKGGST